MSLERWLRNGWLQRNEPTLAEIRQLLQVVDRDISDAQAKGLSADGCFQHAYDANWRTSGLVSSAGKTRMIC